METFLFISFSFNPFIHNFVKWPNILQCWKALIIYLTPVVSNVKKKFNDRLVFQLLPWKKCLINYTGKNKSRICPFHVNVLFQYLGKSCYPANISRQCFISLPPENLVIQLTFTCFKSSIDAPEKKCEICSKLTVETPE